MNATTLRRLRRIHNYLGVFFAPAIVFFAFSGLLQTVGLHEPQKGGAYQPPAWIVTLASLHKDQRLPRPRRPEQGGPEQGGPDRDRSPPVSKGAPASQAPKAAKAPSPIPLKAFVLLVSLALMATTVVGVVIALTTRSTRRASLILLVLGTVLPPLLILV